MIQADPEALRLVAAVPFAAPPDVQELVLELDADCSGNSLGTPIEADKSQIDLRRHRHLSGEFLIFPDAGRDEDAAPQFWVHREFCRHLASPSGRADPIWLTIPKSRRVASVQRRPPPPSHTRYTGIKGSSWVDCRNSKFLSAQHLEPTGQVAGDARVRLGRRVQAAKAVA